jgi:hypothetical protein
LKFLFQLPTLVAISRNNEVHVMTAWRTVLGFDQYEISDEGNVRHKRPRRGDPEILKGSRDKDGYLTVYLCRLEPFERRAIGSRLNRRVHRLAWEAFVGPIPKGMQINHKNGVKFDNRLENLEVCTPAENTRHGFRVLGRKPVMNPHPGSKNGRAKLTEADIPTIRKLIANGATDNELSEQFKVSPASIWWIRRGVTWKHVS